MTDNEIIKNLENAAEWFSEHGRNTNTAIIGICKESVALINRQKAEIERLKKRNSISQRLLSEGWRSIEEKDKLCKTVKTEVIREFAVKLSSRVHKLDIYNCELPYGRQEQGYLVDDVLATIDALIEEITKEETQ